MAEKANLAARARVLREVLRSYFYVVLWMSISISVILFNKWLLAYSGFPFPISLTLWCDSCLHLRLYLPTRSEPHILWSILASVLVPSLPSIWVPVQLPSGAPPVTQT